MLLSIGCRNIKEVEKIKIVTRDSVHTKDSLVIKEKIVYSPVDSAAIKAQVNCPDLKPVKVKSKTATATFEIKNGVAKVNCFCDSAAIRVQEREYYQKQFKQRLNSVETTDKKIVEVPVYPWWLKALASIGAAAIIYFTYKLINFFK